MKLESKISKRIESREFVKEFDNIQISSNNVELNNSIIGRLGSGVIKEKHDNSNNIVGDFLVGGNYYDNNDERILVLNVKFNKFKDVVQPLMDFFNSIEANEFEDVEEFAYETAARLEAEEQARLETEEKARLEAEEQARLEAEEQARLEAEEKARLEAEEKARLEAEEQARLEAEEQARLEAEEQARLEAEEQEGGNDNNLPVIS